MAARRSSPDGRSFRRRRRTRPSARGECNAPPSRRRESLEPSLRRRRRRRSMTWRAAAAAAAAAAVVVVYAHRRRRRRTAPSLVPCPPPRGSATLLKLNFVDRCDSPAAVLAAPGRAGHYIKASPSLSNPSFLIAARLFCADSPFVLYSVEGLDATRRTSSSSSSRRRRAAKCGRRRRSSTAASASWSRLARRRHEPGDGRGLREERARQLCVGRVAIVLRLEHGPLRLDAAAQGSVGDGHRELLEPHWLDRCSSTRRWSRRPSSARCASASRSRRGRRGCRRRCRAGRGRPTSSSTPRRAA